MIRAPLAYRCRPYLSSLLTGVFFGTLLYVAYDADRLVHDVLHVNGIWSGAIGFLMGLAAKQIR